MNCRPCFTPLAETPLRLLLVEDHPMFRAGTRALVEAGGFMQVCGEAETAEEAMEMAERLKPHLAVVDIALRGVNGIEVTRALMSAFPDLRILVVSSHREEIYAERVLHAGAAGFLMKDRAPDELTAALKALASGHRYLSPRLADRFDRPHRPGGNGSLEKTLSDREREVLALLGTGLSTRAIATRLTLSHKTVESYREHLKTKLQLEDGAALIRYAVEWSRAFE